MEGAFVRIHDVNPAVVVMVVGVLLRVGEDVPELA